MKKQKHVVGSVKLDCPMCEDEHTFKPHELKECRKCGYTYTKDEILKGVIVR